MLPPSWTVSDTESRSLLPSLTTLIFSKLRAGAGGTFGHQRSYLSCRLLRRMAFMRTCLI